MKTTIHYRTCLGLLFICLSAIFLAGLMSACTTTDDDDDDDNDAADDDDDDDDNDTSGDDDDDDSDDDDGPEPLFPNVLVAAHRGVTLSAPENTILGIEKAFEFDADIVEMDVRNTLDGYYVLMHDDTVDRTTNGSGRVEDMTLEQIKALTIKTTLYPWLTDPIFVPTFAEALAVIEAHAGQAYVDMKTGEPEGAVQVIVDLGLEQLCFVYASSLDKLDRVRSVSGQVRIQPPSDSVTRTQELIDYFDPDPEHIELAGEAGFSPENIELIKTIDATISMDALGVRDTLALLGKKEAWLEMMEGGVDIIQTDYPAALVEYRDSFFVPEAY